VRKLIGALVSLVTICASTVPFAAHLSPTNGGDVIDRARGAYYNLTRHGFDGFQARIEPNWEVILAQTATPQNLKAFHAVRFSITVDARGAVIVRHEIEDKQKTGVERYVNQIHDDVQRLVASFFRTWGFFMIGSPFPESQVKIETSDKQYHVFYTLQSDEDMLTMSDDLLIGEARFSGLTSKRAIRPIFLKTSQGLLLTNYHTDYEPIGPGIKLTSETSVVYQDVSGMKLPNRIYIKGMYGSELYEAEFTFNQFVMNRRGR
jgi:hypothetical protein